jgi:dipeptidyl aminopeptidase/acylaminoacyl peptidase
MKKMLYLIFALPLTFNAQIELSEIMKGYDFIGSPPTNVRWSAGGSQVCFDRSINEVTKTICFDLKSGLYDTINIKDFYFFDEAQSTYDKQFEIRSEGIAYYNKINDKSNILYETEERILNLQRVNDPNKIYFQKGKNLFVWDLSNKGPLLSQLTNFTQEKELDKKQGKPHLKKQQKELFQYFDEVEKEIDTEGEKKKIFLGKGDLQSLQVDPASCWVVLRKYFSADNSSTEFMDYVTSNGVAQSKRARPKVSSNEPNQAIGIYKIDEDSIAWLDFSALSDIRLKPKYLGDTSGALYEKDRSLFIHPIVFARNKSEGLLDIRSADNKDRWIVLIDFKTATFRELIHEHDEAWIGGPGISSWNMVPGVLDWVSNETEFLFQSERSGYSHLYTYAIESGKVRGITSGAYEVREVQKTKDPSCFYITCNKRHPGNREIYKLNIDNRTLTEVLTNDGAFELTVSPDEKHFAYRYSFMNKPWEVFVSKSSKKRFEKQITHCTSKLFERFKWMVPDVKTFKATDGTPVYMRVYKPDSVKSNNAAVLFVHGAGYLQNAHKFWSNYYREYMFHNLLVAKGYTVLDVDYRGSDGYGRQHRTAIYRHMGGKDLQDYIDVKKFAVDSLGIEEERVGIYGGSYGGFITLMALLTEPKAFACGAALRSVTDWAHYNHEYTSNILNYPETDSVAYRRSSPIYYAENLEKPLLMLHGMVDDNVQFQDVVRLSQRFIELEKKDWNLAVFPVEAHGFKKASSWTDEYRRIFELFETHLKK